jgi:hypothetical protein
MEGQGSKFYKNILDFLCIDTMSQNYKIKDNPGHFTCSFLNVSLINAGTVSRVQN